MRKIPQHIRNALTIRYEDSEEEEDEEDEGDEVDDLEEELFGITVAPDMEEEVELDDKMLESIFHNMHTSKSSYDMPSDIRERRSE